MHARIPYRIKTEEQNNRAKQNVDRYMKKKRNSTRIKIYGLTTEKWQEKLGRGGNRCKTCHKILNKK
jgi:hypothetical protein